VKSQKGNVSEQMNVPAARQKEKNRSILKRIILSIEFLSRLGIPLRGHRDSGKLTLPNTEVGTSSTSIDYTQGNLRATLQLMAACNDEVLRHHLVTASRNATYMSSNSQNDIIDAIATTFEQFIASQVNGARFF